MPPSMPPSPPSPPSPPEEQDGHKRYRVVRRATIRRGFERTSEVLGTLEVGESILVTSSRLNHANGQVSRAQSRHTILVPLLL